MVVETILDRLRAYSIIPIYDAVGPKTEKLEFPIVAKMLPKGFHILSSPIIVTIDITERSVIFRTQLCEDCKYRNPLF